jgi:hypothetical protein
MCPNFNHDQIVDLINAGRGLHKVTSARIAKECSIPPVYLSAFLNRRVNLLDSDIEKIFDYLGIDLEKIRKDKCQDEKE